MQISLRPMEGNSPRHRTIGVVVTDITETRRSEELLRALSKRVVQVQEAERGRVAFELHDNITQLVCAVLFRSQALADHLSPRDGTSKKEAMKLREMLGKTAKEVERISHNLGPTVLDNLGLATALGEAGTKFAERTGVSVKVACVKLTATDARRHGAGALPHPPGGPAKRGEARVRPPRDREPEQDRRIRPAGDRRRRDRIRAGALRGKGRRKRGLGLLSMRERAGYVGAAFKITSKRRSGTEIEILVPMTATVAASIV